MNNVKSTGSYLLRSPLLSINLIEELNSSIMNKDILYIENKIKNIFSSPLLQKALLLASPPLYSEFAKWIGNTGNVENPPRKMIITLYKYLIRMSTRCTPFGIFAGCSLGHFENFTSIEFNKVYKHKTYCRPDSSLVNELISHIKTIPNVIEKSIFYSNNSTYKINNFIRYTESSINEIGLRSYSIEQIETNELVEKIIKFSENGKKYTEVLNFIISNLDPDISENEVLEFLNSLIRNQILIGEWEPTTTGEEYFKTLMKKLKKLNLPIYNDLKILDKLTKRISISNYFKINDIIKKILPSNKINDVVQVDLFLSASSNSINTKTIVSIEKQLNSLSCFLRKSQNQDLENFVASFRKKFEDQEVPLLLALDPEFGIGYGPEITVDYSTLENIDFKSVVSDTYKINKIDELIIDKYYDCLKKGQSKIILTDKDIYSITGRENENNQYPESFFIQGKLIQSDELEGQEKFLITSSFGPSGARLLTRFCHGNASIGKMVKTYIEQEESMHPDLVFAEITHIAQSKVGNILLRPSFRKYEIPYLATPSVDFDHQLPLSDLFVSIRGNLILLRSSKLNKYVIPRLTSAHNFNNGIAAYRFLCDLQFWGQYNLDLYNWKLLNKQPYFPRIEYKNIILSRTSWRLKSKDFKPYLETIDKFSNYTKEFFISNGIPDVFLISKGDNELLLNINNQLSMQILHDEIKKDKAVKLVEHIERSEYLISKNENGDNFSTEICFPFLNKSNKLLDKIEFYSKFLSEKKNIVAIRKTERIFQLGDDWLYYRLHTNPSSSDRVLTKYISPILEKMDALQLVEKWFFIRYADPEPHIRFRIKLRSKKFLAKTINILNKALKPLLDSHLLSKAQTDTYFRELERYGHKTINISECIFYRDSVCVLKILNSAYIKNNNSKLLIGIKGVDKILSDFNINLSKRVSIFKELQTVYLLEHGNSIELVRTLKKNYKENIKVIKECFENKENNSEGTEEVDEYFEERSKYFQTHWDEIKLNNNYSEIQLQSLINSYIHMFINRLFASYPRRHELLIYDHLYAYYKSKNANPTISA